VDAVLRLPGGLIPIDSKFPLAGFRQLVEAATPEQKDRARRQFAREVRKHVDDIADKYLRPAEGTLDLALMYIPAENIFYELITNAEGSGEDDISAYALKRRVVPVSPNSIYAYLQAVAFGLMGMRIEERAREILKGLQQLNGDFVVFEESFRRAQRHLLNAQSAFIEAGEQAGRLGDRLQQFASLAEGPAPEEVLPAPIAPAAEGLRSRGLDS